MNRRTIRLIAGLSLSFLLVVASPLSAQVQIGATITDQGLESFYLGIGDYFHAPTLQIQAVRQTVPPDEAPVVFFLAQRAHVEPGVILHMRSEGRSWMDITLHFGLSPAIFYVPLSVEPGPPYGHAYGYYKKVPRARWSTIRLPDADVVNLVNLRFMRDYYDVEPGTVIRMRHEGKNFAVIGHAAGRKHVKSSPPGASHGKGKSSEKKPGKGHGRGHS